MRLDAFQYFTPEHLPEHLGPILLRNRFDGSIAVSQTPADPRPWLGLMRGHAFVKGAVAWIDLDDPNLELLLDECRQAPKFRGVFHRLADSVPPGLADLAHRGLTLDLLSPPGQSPLAAEIAARFPGLRIAIVHLGSPGIAAGGADDWARGMADLARFPQVFCKASDLIHLTPAPWKSADLRPYVHHVLAAFTPARVMFGSGWPSGLPDRIWKETLAAFTQSIGPQSMEVREDLLGKVAQRFYGIAERPAPPTL